MLPQGSGRHTSWPARCAGLALLVVVAGCGGGSGSASSERSPVDREVVPPSPPAAPPVPPAPPAQPAQRDRYSMANGCYAVRSRQGAYLTRTGDGYSASAADRAAATPFFMKPTALGSYLLYDPERDFLAVTDPQGELVNAAGDLISEVDALVGGVGDSLAVAEPLRPVGGLLREISNSTLGRVGEQAGAARMAPTPGRSSVASDLAVWAVEPAPGRHFSLSALATGQRLAVATDGSLELAAAAGQSQQFEFVPHSGCTDYPEITVNASGTPFGGHHDDGTLFGYADTHIHISAYEFIGGRVNYGAPFHKFGVTHALDNCAVNHGPGGLTGAIEHFTSGNLAGLPLRPHDTRGWPTFNDWPHHSSLQHHQTYYKWIERAWLSGLRLMVNHLVTNEALCWAWPLRRNECDEMASARLQAQRMHELQDYIDAQEGGPGKGWFRIVTEPDEARRVIAEGKLAVVFGMEVSKPFGCGEFLDSSHCDRAQIDRELQEFHDLGVRALFPVHRFDNAFGGAYNGKGVTETVLAAGNVIETGHPFELEECVEGKDQNEQPKPGIFDALLYQLEFWTDLVPQAPAPTDALDPRDHHHSHRCNTRGLTELGEYLIERMIDQGMLIEVDHMGARMRDQVLSIVEARGYPGVVSSHGFLQTDDSERRVVAVGGMVNYMKAKAPAMVDRVLKIADYRSDEFFFSTGFASDINGISAQPGPRLDAAERPLRYPFTSYDGQVVFERQVSGERLYDLNTDGVAHYGLYADLMADIQQNGGAQAEQALEILFRSAEGYLQMWERALEHAGR